MLILLVVLLNVDSNLYHWIQQPCRLLVTMVLMLLLERWREDRVHGGL